MCIFEQEELHMRYTFWSVFAIKNCLGGKCIKFPTNIFFFISCIFYWFRCNDGYTFSVSFFLFLKIALVMKITIKIPFYERFHLMLFVYRENRGNDGYHAQTNKRGETLAGCLQIMMIILQNDLSKIFSWPEGGWITRPNYPPSTWTIFLQVNIHNLTLLTSNV